MKKFSPKFVIAAVVAIGLLTTGSAAGCTGESSAAQEDEATSEQMLKDYQKSQPVEIYKYSQYRENLRDVLRTQADATPTTTFVFNQGVADPILVCPSIGFPIPSTAQLTNPQQIARSYQGGYAIMPQVEPNGVFTGESSGTYVVCRDANGNGFGDYWEGNVNAVTGPAEWDYDKKLIVLIGAPTGEFSTGE